MMNIKNEKGFTLIELILVVAILGILAVAVAPQVGNIMANSQTRSRQGTIGMVQSGINTYFSDQLAANGVGAWPATLDGQANGTCATCFETVLAQPINSADWKRNSDTVYEHVPTGVTATYVPATGQFQ